EQVLEAVGSAAPARLAAFHETGELDTAYQPPYPPRFRVHTLRQRGDISFAFRAIPNEVPTFDQLRLPQGVRNLADENRGLILVTGATGVGQTTALVSGAGHHHPTPPAAHRHNRGSDRDPPLRRELHRQPARGRA